MSPATKQNSKWILTITSVVIGILVTVITSTAAITSRFNQNDADHAAICIEQTSQGRLIATEAARSKQVDKEVNGSIHRISINQEVMKNTLIQQKELLKKIEEKL